MPESSDYKASKEAFVSNTTGSTLLHVNSVSFVAISSLVLYFFVRPRLFPSRKLPSQALALAVDYSLLVLPLLFSLTVFATRPLLLSALLLTPAALLALFTSPVAAGRPLLPSSRPPSPVSFNFPDDVPGSRYTQHGEGEKGRKDSAGVQSKRAGAIPVPTLPALTMYRAHMMLMTVLCILAVDFPVFPRALAKCETFGFSVMDLGVGSFVFSTGLVSALPILKDPQTLLASSTSSLSFLPQVEKLVVVVRRTIPVAILGVVRVVLVKGTAYPVTLVSDSRTQEHVSEYGAHWNFFLTLAVVPVLQVVLHPMLARWGVWSVGMGVAVAQQLLLSQFGLHAYVLDAPRTGLISANKEGLVSLTGYLAIHILGLAAGTLLLPPTPASFRRHMRALGAGKARRHADSASAAAAPAPAAYSTSYTFPRPADPAAGDGDEGAAREGRAQVRARVRPPSRLDSDSDSDADADGGVAPEADADARADPARRSFDGGQGQSGVLQRQTAKTATELCAYALLYWILLGGCWVAGIGGGVSRRMVNLPYVLWVVAFNTSFLVAYLLLDMAFVLPSSQSPSPSVIPLSRSSSSSSAYSYSQGASLRVPSTASGSAADPGGPRAPALLEAVNRNGLVVFLAANLLTGLVNVVVPTLYTADGPAVLVLGGYSCAVCAVAWGLRGRRVW